MQTKSFLAILLFLYLLGCRSSSPNPPIAPCPPSSNAWIITEGKGSTRRGAISRAWRKAMIEYAKTVLRRRDFLSHERAIKHFLTENWRIYCKGGPEHFIILQRYYRRRIKIKVKLREHLLCRDLRARFM